MDIFEILEVVVLYSQMVIQLGFSSFYCFLIHLLLFNPLETGNSLMYEHATYIAMQVVSRNVTRR